MGWLGLEAEEYDRQYKDRALFARIIDYLRPYKKRAYAVILFLTLSSAANAITPLVSSMIINAVDITGDPVAIVLLVVLAAALNVTGWAFNYVRQKNSVTLLSAVVLDMQQAAVKALYGQDFHFFDRQATGKLVSRVNSDTRNFWDMAELVMETASSLVILFLVFVPMFFINIILASWLCLVIPVIFIVASAYRKIARKRTLLGQRSLALVNDTVQENISGIQITKTFRQEAKVLAKFTKINDQAYKVNMRRAMVLNFIFPTLDLTWGVFIGLLVFFGGNMILASGLVPGDLYLFLQSAWLLFFPLFSVAAFWPQFQTGLSAAERVFAMIDAPRVVKQTGNVPISVQGRIDVDHLSFEYIAGKKIFDDFSVNIKPGESIAVVGHTGAGKSTLAKLLMRFYEYQGGEIRIDGISLRDVDLSIYKRQVGYIPQTPFLWADTVENNIKTSKPDATRDEVMAAVELAGGADWVAELPNGIETNVSEKGKLLSAGQRQLVALARVFLARPKILILDEATASVDPFTETKIQEALQNAMRGRTSIIIAHRLWTVRNVDRILVLDHGRIVEQGSHDQLMAKNGTYAALYDTYFKHQSYEFLESIGKT
ncbi:MAG: ABC transporter ATP-binding protein [Candidatus Sigynarchaeota archaeon]